VAHHLARLLGLHLPVQRRRLLDSGQSPHWLLSHRGAQSSVHAACVVLLLALRHWRFSGVFLPWFQQWRLRWLQQRWTHRTHVQFTSLSCLSLLHFHFFIRSLFCHVGFLFIFVCFLFHLHLVFNWWCSICWRIKQIADVSICKSVHSLWRFSFMILQL